MSQNRTRTPLFQNDRRSIDPYKASYKAARKEQEATPKEEQPAPPDVLTQERKRLLDEITQENEARERREKMAKESRENQPFEELSNQLQRPGNQAKAKGTEGIRITVPNSAMKGWFAFPKGVSDDNKAIPLVNRNTGEPLSDEEVISMAYELKNCDKELTDRVFWCSYDVGMVFGKLQYNLSQKFRKTLTKLFEELGQKPRDLRDGVYSGAMINRSTSTCDFPMVLSDSTMSLGDDNLLAIEPSYDKVKIAPFTVRDGAVVKELQTITLSDLPSSVNRKK